MYVTVDGLSLLVGFFVFFVFSLVPFMWAVHRSLRDMAEANKRIANHLESIDEHLKK
jgi:uncharacterized membrane protein YqhA